MARGTRGIGAGAGARRAGAVLAIGLLAAACASQPPADVVFKGAEPLAQEPATPAAAEAQTAAIPESGAVVVAAGDSVYAIARRYNLSIRGLIDSNGLEPPFTLTIGQRLVLPRERVHTVAAGDTLYGISRRYGVAMAVLARANGLGEPYALTVGQRLRIPTLLAKPPEPEIAEPAAKPESPVPAVEATIQATIQLGVPPVPPPKPAILTASAAPTTAASGALPPPPPRSKNTFLWPVEGDVINGFGPQPGGRHNDGINIVAPRGTAVRAAENGVVAYIGNELRGYGNLVLIRHADGWITAYAHNEVVLVSRGEIVRRGDIIGRVGSTGDVATPQTHFELRQGVRSVDPMKYLAWN